MAEPGWICPNCGSVGNPRRVTQGSFAAEVVLWTAGLLLFWTVLFPVAALAYSVWRLTQRTWRCPVCQAQGMVPLNSPRGIQLYRDLN